MIAAKSRPIWFKSLLRSCARMPSYACQKLKRIVKISHLKLKGVDVPWNANIAWSAVFEVKSGRIQLGNSIIVSRGVVIDTSGGEIAFGDFCSVNPYCVIYGHGGLTIGNSVNIAAGSIIIPANHTYEDHTRINSQPLNAKGIEIEDDVWIAAGTKILDGVRISKGVIVGAGSVVVRSLPEAYVCSGVPCIPLRKRYA